MMSSEAKEKKVKKLRRNRREWILPPAKLMENIDYTHMEYVAKIRSDKDKFEKVQYFLSGEGADKNPLNLFVVDRETGFVRITDKLDREKCPYYNLTGIARYRNGTTAEDNIPLTVTVLDQNDNAPSFELHTGNINEASEKGTFVMQLEGKDNDQAGTINAEISYRIASQTPAGTGHMFHLDEKTGKLYVKEPTLDRETYDFYRLVIKLTDMGGAASGLTGTGTVEIKILDINDNMPTLEKSEYSGSVDENVDNVVVMKIKALDKDQEHTDNWLTRFTISKGNDDNLFSIETDNKTNEGILKLIKVFNTMDVGTKLKPNAPKSYPIKISVNNVPEGPAFVPDTKVVHVSEDPKEAPKDGKIAVFTATDPDTGKTAEDVSYAKAYDPDNLFTIDEETAEIKLNKIPDRESSYLKNGTYIAKILAITKDMPSKTATGTIAIQVTDGNDHCPTLTTNHASLCSDQKSVYITGIDADVSPNAAPFTFRIIPDGTQGSWVVEVINETSAAIHSHVPLWPGQHNLQVEVLDAQGLSCPTKEVFTVNVCTCSETEDCSRRTARLGATSSKLAAPAIGLLLLALCLLLFIPFLLVICQYAGADKIFPDQFNELPFLPKENLISYHTEGRGEDKEMSLQCLPVMLQKVKMGQSSNFNMKNSNIMEIDEIQIHNEQKYQAAVQTVMEVDNAYTFSRESVNLGNGRASFNRKVLGIQHTKHLYEDMDSHLEYDFEGQGSSAGSVGCCSLLEDDNDLDFLTELGPKFKTLAEICIQEHIVETKHADIKTERLTSNTNVLQSSVSTVSTARSMTLPTSKNTTVSRSSHISNYDTLPSPVQTVLLQQEPIYYTSSVSQPIQYVVQPHLQNTLLLVDGSNGTNRFFIQDIERSRNPASHTVPTSPIAFLPISPAMSLGSTEDRKLMQLNGHFDQISITLLQENLVNCNPKTHEGVVDCVKVSFKSNNLVI
uniref:Si:ch73-74h11.1 n=1 Tax=Oreochromis niloticus TaxID=8128 RepID=I3JLS7_ORENI